MVFARRTTHITSMDNFRPSVQLKFDSIVVDQIQDQRLEFHLLQILIQLKGSEIRQLLL